MMRSLRVRIFYSQKVLMKTMVRQIVLAFFLLVLSLSACKEEECPPSERLGTAFLMQESLDKVPEVPGEHIIFRNEAGRELQYGNFSDTFFGAPFLREKVIGQLCDRRNSDSYYLIRTERVRGDYYLKNGANEHSVNFYFELGIVNVSPNTLPDTSLVDEIRVLSQPFVSPSPAAVPPPHDLALIISYRGRPGQIPQEVQFLDTITLLDRTFSDVYVNTNGLAKIYYNFELGIVAFEDLDGDIWVFDRFE